LRRKGDPSKARKKALRALEVYPDHVDAMNLIALIHMEDFEYDRARDVYKKAIEAAIREQGGVVKVKDAQYWLQPETRPYIRARHGYGFCLAYLGQHKEALDQFNLLLKLDPEDRVGVRFLLADLYHFVGNTKKAEKYYKESDSADAAFNYALLLHCLGREQEARLILKRASSRSPVVRSVLSEYISCFILWETLESYKWGTFPPFNLHRNALEMACNANANQTEDSEAYSRLEGAYNFCNLCGPLWLRYQNSFFFLTEGHPASS
jgi:tetratricopeptide (TPR) repeat protein